MTNNLFKDTAIEYSFWPSALEKLLVVLLQTFVMSSKLLYAVCVDVVQSSKSALDLVLLLGLLTRSWRIW